MENTKTGVELIAQERKRQIESEGWSLEHDKQHDEGQLADAAAVYAMDEGTRSYLDISWGNDEWLNIWPFELESLKIKPEDRIKELTKAGAQIASENERLNSSEEKK
jgi:hypothetical protein